MEQCEALGSILKTGSSKATGEKMAPELRNAVLQDLRSGMGMVAVATKHGLSHHIVSALRDAAEEENPAFNLVAWKKSTAATLSRFVSKGAEKLEKQVEEMPLQSLPIAIAVAIDKLLLLHDQPQTIVEHRLRVDHNSVNELLRSEGPTLEAEIVDDQSVSLPQLDE